jgi:starvation-inducible DNA-binding protein
MDELKDSLKHSFATVFAFYLKTANFHWNVEGANFYEYHKLFEDIYTDVYNSIDPLAEHIRTLNTYTPASFARIVDMSSIEDVLTPLNSVEMLKMLGSDNQLVIDCLNSSFMHASKNNLQGLMNFLADRIDQHQKWAWFLRASNKQGK